VFATCTYQEFQPTMKGVPTRSSNGYPYRLRLPYLLKTGAVQHTMPLTFPPSNFRDLTERELTFAYIRQLDETGVSAIRDAAGDLLTRLGRVGDRLVLLCYERLDKDPFCHRRLFAKWWQDRTGEEVPELGALPKPHEIASQQHALFD
jgi:hypothetical protein